MAYPYNPTQRRVGNSAISTWKWSRNGWEHVDEDRAVEQHTVQPNTVTTQPSSLDDNILTDTEHFQMLRDYLGNVGFRADGAKYMWYHTNWRETGWISFFLGGVLRCSFGNGSGEWMILDQPGQIVAIFGTTKHILEFQEHAEYEGQFHVVHRSLRDGFTPRKGNFTCPPNSWGKLTSPMKFCIESTMETRV